MKSKLLFILFLLFLPATVYVQELYYKVVGVKDGDTIEILNNGFNDVVRLKHIDAPEKKQPYGNASKKYLSDLCFNKEIRMVADKRRDRNGRILAEIFDKQGRNLNKLMVRNGLAWHYKRYSNDRSYDELEKLARNEKLGLWKEPNAVAPWEFRKAKRKPKQH
jgi:endonuclease YncB( thermonuclease family)